MASTQDKLKIFENVLARIGLGGDVLSEYTKALSALNGLDTMSQMQPPMPSTPTTDQTLNQPQPQMNDIISERQTLV